MKLWQLRSVCLHLELHANISRAVEPSVVLFTSDKSSMDSAPSSDDFHFLGIDRKHLKEIRNRFLAINYQRLERTKKALSIQQARVIDLLPLLLHVNHPLLPGYIGQDTPAGLSGYKPDKFTLRQAKQLSRSFHYHPLKSRFQPIEALYIMGSVGTIGQSRKSDLDIWVCHSSDLKKNSILELQKKCQQITDWAKTIGLDICFFPMDAQQFRQGETTPLSEESSGSTQHGLLLDEFYRSAIYLGGRYPLWWFVPADHERDYENYSRELLEKRFLRQTEIIDFGAPQVAVTEYVTAAIWQLYKGIHSPHKSVLKLLLLEVYAAQYPQTQLLSVLFKSRVESGCDDINQLDPYLLVYSSLENYLQEKKADKRLDIVRRCLYFKVDKPLSRRSSVSVPTWQRLQLETLVNAWGWDKQFLRHLDQRRSWKTQQVVQERQQLVNELLNSYRFLAEFVRRQNASFRHLQSELSILGKKLYAAFERKGGKIEWINPDISPDISEPYLTLGRRPVLLSSKNSNNSSNWSLNALASQQEYLPDSQLKSSLSALELIVWAYCNEIFTSDTNCCLQTDSHSIYSLKNLYFALHQWLPLPLATTTQTDFEAKPHARSTMLVLNFHQPSTLATIGNELELDPLNVGKRHLSLISDGHILIHNSWNEVFVHSFGLNSLESLVTEYLRQLYLPAHAQAPKVTIFCREGDLSALLKQRVERLFDQLSDYFLSHKTNFPARFILQNNGTYSLWQKNGRQVDCDRFSQPEELLVYLGRPQHTLSPIRLDSQTLRNHPVAEVLKLPLSEAIQIVYLTRHDTADIYILDEKGSLFHTSMAFHDEATLLRPLHQFVRKTIDHQNLISDINSHFGIYPVEFYQLTGNPKNQGYTIEPKHIINNIDDLDFYKIQVIIDIDASGELYHVIYCEQEEFHQADYGIALFKVVASHILQMRDQKVRYPCYITDLDLSRGAELISPEHPLQVSHYLQLKNEIEARLNRELLML